MAYRYGNREQISFLPMSIEEYIAPDDPVRAYDAFMEALDIRELGIMVDEHQVGNAEYDPLAMLKLLVYGYSYGTRSSRKLERAVYHNLSFIWLLGGLKPDHKTIAEFRRQHKPALSGILKQCARMCLKLGLVEGNTLFVDGTQLRANASLAATWSIKRCEEMLSKVDARVEAILSECDAVDEAESGDGTVVHMEKELAKAETLRRRVEEIVLELKATGKKSLNTTDGESYSSKSPRGYHMAYNGQISVDGKHGLIVSSDVVRDPFDRKLLSGQKANATEVLGKEVLCIVADAGYHDIEVLKEMEQERTEKDGVLLVVPNANQVSKKARERYGREGFIYDSATDTFRCPEGHAMVLQQIDERRKRNRYAMVDHGSTCKKCGRWGVCTNAAEGRKINRHMDQEWVDKWARQYEENKAIYRLRKEMVELPFGHIKHNMHFESFLLRGLAGVKAEMALLANSFNLTRMINILGVRPLIAKIAG